MNEVCLINKAVHTLEKPQNLLRNISLILEICSQIDKILKYFSQNKKNKLTEKNFLSFLQEI